jgi:DNA-binding CsgD family transcriptional regulator
MPEARSSGKTGRERPGKACASGGTTRRRADQRSERSFVSELGVSLEALERVLDTIGVAIIVLDRARAVRWLNASATKLLGPMRGRDFDGIAAPEYRHAIRGRLAKLLIRSSETIEFEFVVFDRTERRLPMMASFVPLVTAEKGVVGILGTLVHANPRQGDATNEATRRLAPELTPRQHEVLRLLGEGRGTTEIATMLGVSHETARNHIRGVLLRLGAHSRLEAVALAHRFGDAPAPSPTAAPDGSHNAQDARIAARNQNDANGSGTESVAAGTLDDETYRSDRGGFSSGREGLRRAS